MPRQSRFFQFVILSSVISLAFYIFAGVMIVRYGTLVINLGWEEKSENGWVISYVDSHGPANGNLKLGDKIISLNGDNRVSTAGSNMALREIPHLPF